MGFPGGSVVKNPPGNVGDVGSVPELGRSLGGGNGNSLQYSCLQNSMDSGAWQATVHGVAKSWTQLSTHSHSLSLPPICEEGMASSPYCRREAVALIQTSNRNPSSWFQSFKWWHLYLNGYSTSPLNGYSMVCVLSEILLYCLPEWRFTG